MKKTIKQIILALVLSLTLTGAAMAHTITLGFEATATPGSVDIWAGTYSGHSTYVPTEGSVNVVGVNGTIFNTTLAFTTPILSKPTGLVDGVSNWYAVGGQNATGFTADDGTYWGNNFGCCPIVWWQGVTVSGLSAGDYQFTFVPDPSPTVNWSFWNDSLNGTFTLDQTIVGSPVPEPSTFILLASGLAGVAYFRRKNK